MIWALRGFLAAALIAAAAMSYWHGARVEHLAVRIGQASAQAAALDTLGASLHDELLKSVLEPDIDKAKEALSQFERDVMHALGILEQLTEVEVEFVGEGERSEEEEELVRPAMLREAAVRTLTAARRVINVRQSADIMVDATSPLDQLETERTAISEIVAGILKDEREEISLAIDKIATTQQSHDRWMIALLPIAALSALGAHGLEHRNRRAQDAKRARALASFSQKTTIRLDAADPLADAFSDVERQIIDLAAAKGSTEHQLEQRSAALQLSASKLKQIDETRRRFLADLGHSLKTPLAIARGSVEALPQDGQKRDAAIEAIDQVTRRVSDLLQLSRSDDGRLMRQNQYFELTEFLDNRVAEMSALPQGEFISLSTDGEGPYEIEGDREALTRMFDAIIENGLRYAAPDTPLSIAISAAAEGVLVSIADQGPGIAHGQEIFERDTSFYQGGTGIGLAMARQIALDHGGQIDLAATGRGARFDISLPLAAMTEG